MNQLIAGRSMPPFPEQSSVGEVAERRLSAPFIGCPLSDANAGCRVYNPLQPHLNLKISFFFKNKQIFSTSLKNVEDSSPDLHIKTPLHFLFPRILNIGWKSQSTSIPPKNRRRLTRRENPRRSNMEEPRSASRRSRGPRECHLA
jgi:hypothetical protein